MKKISFLCFFFFFMGLSLASPVKSIIAARLSECSSDNRKLPEGIVEVQYIYTEDRKPFINTIYADTDMSFEMGFLNSTQKAMAFGSLLGTTSRFCFPASSSDFFYFGGKDNVRMASSVMTLNTYHDVSMSKNGIYVDGTLLPSSISSAQYIQSTILLSLNGWNYNGRNESRGAMRIYYFRAWKGGVRILDLIAVRFLNEKGEWEGAMYDWVSGELFRNSGTGSFLIGPDKE